MNKPYCFIPSLAVLVLTFLIVPPAFSEEGVPQEQIYRVSSGDILDVEVFEAEELGKTARVSHDGFISIPLVGPVQVKGMTEREVEDELEKLLGAKYLQNPQVSVFVKDGGYFYVLGKVEKETGGQFPFTPGITLQQAIAMAGGFTRKEDADLKNIRITRNVEGGGKRVFNVDYTEIMAGKTPGILLAKGDVVFVRSLGKYYVSGYVRSPRSFDLRQGTTLLQAIASAGGIGDVGKASRVQITRIKDDGGVEKIVVNYDKIRAGKAEDLGIREDDIIYVPKSYALAMVRTFFFTLGVGGGDSVGVRPTTFVER